MGIDALVERIATATAFVPSTVVPKLSATGRTTVSKKKQTKTKSAEATEEEAQGDYCCCRGGRGERACALARCADVGRADVCVRARVRVRACVCVSSLKKNCRKAFHPCCCCYYYYYYHHSECAHARARARASVTLAAGRTGWTGRTGRAEDPLVHLLDAVPKVVCAHHVRPEAVLGEIAIDAAARAADGNEDKDKQHDHKRGRKGRAVALLGGGTAVLCDNDDQVEQVDEHADDRAPIDLVVVVVAAAAAVALAEFVDALALAAHHQREEAREEKQTRGVRALHDGLVAVCC